MNPKNIQHQCNNRYSSLAYLHVQHFTPFPAFFNRVHAMCCLLRGYYNDTNVPCNTQMYANMLHQQRRISAFLHLVVLHNQHHQLTGLFFTQICFADWVESGWLDGRRDLWIKWEHFFAVVDYELRCHNSCG